MVSLTLTTMPTPAQDSSFLLSLIMTLSCVLGKFSAWVTQLEDEACSYNTRKAGAHTHTHTHKRIRWFFKNRSLARVQSHMPWGNEAPVPQLLSLRSLEPRNHC